MKRHLSIPRQARQTAQAPTFPAPAPALMCRPSLAVSLVQALAEDSGRPEPYRLPVHIGSGAIAFAEFLVRTDQVEIWHHGAHEGTFDRPVLAAWLLEPTWAIPVGNGSVLFRCEGAYRVTLTLSDVQDWPLTRQQVAELHHHVRR